MTECSPIPKKPQKTARLNAIKSPRIYIDPNDLHLMRRRAFLTTRQTAELLDVTHRLEKRVRTLPYTAYWV